MRGMSSLALTLFVASLVALPFVTTPGTAYAAKNEKEGETVTIDQVPAPVKTTLDKESKGGSVGQITKETTSRGKTYYEAEVEKGGKRRYVHVDPNGKVLKHESAKTEAKEQAREK